MLYSNCRCANFLARFRVRFYIYIFTQILCCLEECIVVGVGISDQAVLVPFLANVTAVCLPQSTVRAASSSVGTVQDARYLRVTIGSAQNFTNCFVFKTVATCSKLRSILPWHFFKTKVKIFAAKTVFSEKMTFCLDRLIGSGEEMACLPWLKEHRANVCSPSFVRYCRRMYGLLFFADCAALKGFLVPISEEDSFSDRLQRDGAAPRFQKNL